MSHEKDAGDKCGRDVAVVETDQRFFMARRIRRHDGFGCRAHTGSLILCHWLAAGWSIVWTLPEGQRMTAFSIFGVLPSPKCRRRSFCAAKPVPPETSCACIWPFQYRVIFAPIALRLLAVPSR